MLLLLKPPTTIIKSMDLSSVISYNASCRSCRWIGKTGGQRLAFENDRAATRAEDYGLVWLHHCVPAMLLVADEAQS